MTLPQVNRDAELAIQRKNTEWFIAWNPYPVILIPQVKTKTGTGTEITDGIPRAEQTMRLIPQNEVTPPTTKNNGVTLNGVERVITHVLLGLYDAVLAVGDHWRDGDGFYYEVLFVGRNGYESKGLIEQHGNK